jgi:exopolyphosphatase/guanosine-5'-triphosphate,3'-diphosphate pyrophosphatase
VATSAVRDAENGQTFLAAASEAAGVQAELLAGDEEGRLAFAGATADLGETLGDDVVVDIGGGSTELVVRGPFAVEAISLDIGCVRLTERYLRTDPPTAQELTNAVGWVGAELDRAVDSVPALGRLRPNRRLIGLAGTVSTLAALDQGLVEYDRDRIHHAVLLADTVEHWFWTLAGEPSAKRLERPGMLEGRQDVIVGGTLVLREVMRRFSFDECLVSEADMLDGMARSLLEGGPA